MAVVAIPEDQVIKRLQQDNVWWTTGQIDEEYAAWNRRLYFEAFYGLLGMGMPRRAVLLMGPRRVGKTILIFQAIQALLDTGVSPHRIAYISVENPYFQSRPLETLFQLCRQATGGADPDGWYVFFDEIQYLKDWEIHLKTMVDGFPRTKFVASGSAAAALKLKSMESGAGRFTDFLLPPLAFCEYMHLLGLDTMMIPSQLDWKGNLTDVYDCTDMERLNAHFVQYINYGGYPEVLFNPQMQMNPGRFIKSDIIDKVLLRDLPSLYGIRDVQELNSLFTHIAYNSGQEFTLEGLSQGSAGMDKQDIRKYLQYLEAAFLIQRVERIDHTARKFRRVHSFKLYLTNPSLRSALFTPLSSHDPQMGPMVETAIFAQWLHWKGFDLWYAHWKQGRTEGEVDMVGLTPAQFKPAWALEIKWSNRYLAAPGELKSLLQFCETNHLNAALVTTIDQKGLRSLNRLNLYYLPCALYAYSIGMNIIAGAKDRI